MIYHTTSYVQRYNKLKTARTARAVTMMTATATAARTARTARKARAATMMTATARKARTAQVERRGKGGRATSKQAEGQVGRRAGSQKDRD